MQKDIRQQPPSLYPNRTRTPRARHIGLACCCWVQLAQPECKNKNAHQRPVGVSGGLMEISGDVAGFGHASSTLELKCAICRFPDCQCTILRTAEGLYDAQEHVLVHVPVYSGKECLESIDAVGAGFGVVELFGIHMDLHQSTVPHTNARVCRLYTKISGNSTRINTLTQPELGLGIGLGDLPGSTICTAGMQKQKNPTRTSGWGDDHSSVSSTVSCATIRSAAFCARLAA